MKNFKFSRQSPIRIFDFTCLIVSVLCPPLLHNLVQKQTTLVLSCSKNMQFGLSSTFSGTSTSLSPSRTIMFISCSFHTTYLLSNLPYQVVIPATRVRRLFPAIISVFKHISVDVNQRIVSTVVIIHFEPCMDMPFYVGGTYLLWQRPTGT